MLEVEDVVLIKINKSYQENMSKEELYKATSVSWVASFGRTSTRDLKYYCAVYKNEIIEVYDFLGFEEEIPHRVPARYILNGQVNKTDLRSRLVGLDIGSIHKGSGNPIKYTTLARLRRLGEDMKKSDDVVLAKGKGKLAEQDLVRHIEVYIRSRGFNYSAEDVRNFYLSLRSKPFVIISGISGTGKTKIVQLFAEGIGATEENGQFKLIPVRPDWSDSSELLGYVDIKGDLKKGPFLEIVEHANEYPELPHFVLLDEMNLARVEYYFSDVLSVMESRRRVEDKVISSYLLDEKIDGKYPRLPENLFIIGTVNMDETTHPFSKKVLDRANTIEFNEINLDDFSFLEMQEEVNQIKVDYKEISASFISLKDVYEDHESLIIKTSKKISEINHFLELLNTHVGYRVRDEICFYMIHNANSELLSENAAFDFCMMQKILPRITGSDDRVHQLLNNIFEWLTNIEYDAENVAKSNAYPRSAKKVAEMLRRYHLDGFTSFWVS